MKVSKSEANRRLLGGIVCCNELEIAKPIVPPGYPQHWYHLSRPTCVRSPPSTKLSIQPGFVRGWWCCEIAGLNLNCSIHTFHPISYPPHLVTLHSVVNVKCFCVQTRQAQIRIRLLLKMEQSAWFQFSNPAPGLPCLAWWGGRGE